MSKQLPLVVAGIIFSIVAIAHLLRYIYHWDLVAAGHTVPMAVSEYGFVVAALLAFWMFIASRKK